VCGTRVVTAFDLSTFPVICDLGGEHHCRHGIGVWIQGGKYGPTHPMNVA
jgi:hypothetical protein